MKNGWLAVLSGAAVIGSIANGTAIVASAEPPKSAPALASGNASGTTAPLLKEREAAEAANRFGWDLFQKSASESAGKNVFLSPICAFFALSMVYNGAGGETRAAIGKTLHLTEGDASLDALNMADAGLRSSLTAPDTSVTLTIANALWADKRAHFLPPFLARMQASYSGHATTLDFKSSEAAAAINDWAAKNTNGKITSLLQPPDLADPADAVLTSAIYFKGLWTQPFVKESTENLPFHRGESAGGDKVTPMMHAVLKAGYLHSDAFDAVRLPYGDGRFAMYAFLPAQGSNLAAFIPQLTEENWSRWQVSLSPESPVDIALPQFKVAYDADLKASMKSLGMGIAFTRRADFRQMLDLPSYIDKVLQKAVLEVNEEGSEAAAVTTVIMASRSAAVRRHPRQIVFDRPFVCAICDGKTGAILFLGAVSDPE